MPADDHRSDEQLLLAARSERAAFVAFYRRHAEDTKRWLERHAAREPETVQDLLAETFAQALVSLPRFRPRGPGSAASWLHGIARNQQRHFHRRRRVAEDARRRLGMAVGPTPDEWGEHEERLLSEQLRPMLEAALAALPADQRAAVVLRVVREQDYADVARSLGCSEQAARARVSRGLRALKAGIGPAPDSKGRTMTQLSPDLERLGAQLAAAWRPAPPPGGAHGARCCSSASAPRPLLPSRWR